MLVTPRDRLPSCPLAVSLEETLVLLLLHISDIHFRSPNCLTPDQDAERPYRTRMVQDVRDRVAELGSAHAILVGGDIAFKGAPEEYKVARAWIEELASAAGCPLERIFLIPGNHDIDRATILSTPTVRNAQDAITRADRYQQERELQTQIHDIDTGRALLLPLAAYNDFAKPFACQVYLPEQLYWKQDLKLEHGVRTRHCKESSGSGCLLVGWSRWVGQFEG